MRFIFRLPLLALFIAQLATGEATGPTGEEVAAMCMLNQLRTDYRRGEAVVLEAIRAKTVTITESVWSKSAKYAKSTPPPAVWHPALQIAAAGLLTQGAKLPDKALFDAGPALQQAGYPAAAAGGLVLMSADAPSLAVAFARACTTIIKETDKGKYTAVDLAAHEACVETWREIGVVVKTGKSGVSICLILGKGSAPLLAGGTVYRDANRNGRYDPGEGVVGAIASLGTLRMTTGPGGAWWLAGPAAPGQNLSLAVDGLTLSWPQPAAATAFGHDWNVPTMAEIKRLDQLIAEAEKANAGTDEAKRAVPQAALLIAARALGLDDSRAAKVPKLIESVQYRFDNTREKVLEALGESPADAVKLITAQKKAWAGAMPEWFKEAAALPRLREQVMAVMKQEAVAAEKPGKALLTQLDKATAGSVESSFLDLYRTWQEQITEHLASAREPAKKR